MTVAIDHVIWGTRDLDAAGRRFWDEHGLASYEGGVHPAFGTGNRIVPLGDCYVELMGIADESMARENPLGQFLLDATRDGDRWVLWCLRTDDIQDAATRIGSVVVPGERRRPDGGVVAWRLTGLEIALTQPPLPFFIAWDDPATYPGATPLEHRSGATGIAGVTIAGADASIKAHAGGPLPITSVDGSPGIRGVKIRTDAAPLRL